MLLAKNCGLEAEAREGECPVGDHSCVQSLLEPCHVFQGKIL